ncbi:hypothetical protein BLD49_12885 [Erwinia sp. OLMDSP33]|nr:hypothetical protein BLD49_12885 [Erwinia sp. OLMDSP33]
MTFNTCNEHFKEPVEMDKDLHSTFSHAITIVDACHFGRLGLYSLLTHPQSSTEVVSVSVHEQVESALIDAHSRQADRKEDGAERCLVLRLPPCPVPALQQLLYLDNEEITQAGIQRLIVLSPFSVNNVIRQVLVCGGVRVPVRFVNARSAVTLLRQRVLSQGSLLREEDELLPRIPTLILSLCERQVLIKTLLEIPIDQQARQQQRNNKTLYAQRYNALRKLRASGLNDLLRRFVSM